jgi:hypothetical protein
MTTASSRATPAGPVESLLTRARKRIEAPEAWTQGYPARNADGLAVPHASPTACKWCIVGTVWVERDQTSHYTGKLGFQLIEEASGCNADEGGIAGFNDAVTTTHAEVIAAFDRAISLAKDRRL